MAVAAPPVGSRVPRKKRRSGLSERRLAGLMVSPSILLIALVAAYPIGYAVWLSLNEYSVRTPGLSRFAGLRNYEAAISSSDWQGALTTTFAFTGLSVFFELVIGLGMAMIMHSAFKGRGLLRTVVLVPYAILTVVTAITWQTIFNPELGFVTTTLSSLGLPGADTVWLGERGWALAVFVIADVWKTAPFMALLLLAGLQVISDEIYDAAKVDGASPWQRFTRVTLPLLRPAILVALIFRTLDALRVFDLPFILTRGANGTNTLSLEAYTQFNQNGILGLGAAMSVLTFVIVMLVSFVYIRFIGGSMRGMTEDR